MPDPVMYTAVLVGRFIGTAVGEAVKIAAPVVIPILIAEWQKPNTGEVGKANEAANAMLPPVSVPDPAAGVRVQPDEGEAQHDPAGGDGVRDGAGGDTVRAPAGQKW